MADGGLPTGVAGGGVGVNNVQCPACGREYDGLFEWNEHHQEDFELEDLTSAIVDEWWAAQNGRTES